MAITKKPKTKATAPAVDVDALIRKGGSVASAGNDKAKTLNVVLRIPSAVADRIDQSVQARQVKIPRHTWLLEAIIEKLDRESK